MEINWDEIDDSIDELLFQDTMESHIAVRFALWRSEPSSFGPGNLSTAHIPTPNRLYLFANLYFVLNVISLSNQIVAPFLPSTHVPSHLTT